MAKVKHVFKNHLGNASFVLTSGKFCHFKDGRYLTDVEYEIQSLTREVELGHPHIWIDPNEVECEEKTPEEALQDIKAAAIKEYLASQGQEATAKTLGAGADIVTAQLGGIQTSISTQENSQESTGTPAPSLLSIKK